MYTFFAFVFSKIGGNKCAEWGIRIISSEENFPGKIVLKIPKIHCTIA